MGWLIGQDLRYAVRGLRAARGFAVVAILTLGLGIGATTAIFSLVNGLLLRDPGVPHLDHLVVLTTATGPRSFRPGVGLTLEELRAIREAGIPGVRTVFVSTPLVAAMSADGQSKVLSGELVTAGYFSALDLRPVVGRVLGEADDRAAEVGGPVAAVVSERLWREWFQASPAAVGTVVRITGEPVTIVGVLPDSFAGTWLPTILRNDVWVPAAAMSRVWSVQGSVPSADARWRTFARLSDPPLATPATASIASIVRGLNPDEPDRTVSTMPGREGVLFDAFTGPGVLVGTGVTVLALLVFLIACSNLTNLLLARGTYRQGELAIRLATGASRGRIFRLVFAEAVVLTAASAIVGLGMAVGLSHLLMAVPIPELDYMRVVFDASPDWRVFAFGLAAAFVATLAIGLLPAWRATRLEPWRVLAAGGVGGATPHRRRAQGVLVMAQVGMSVVLLLVAGLYLRSAWMAETFDPGYAGGHAAMASVDFRLHRIDEARGRRLQADLLEAARRIPGVTTAALATGVPDGQGTESTVHLLPEGETPRIDPRLGAVGHLTRFLRVSPGFFRTIGLSVLQGREFTQAEVDLALPVAIVSDSTAERFWPGQNPIGKRVQTDRDGPMREVVGVVGTVVRAQGNPTDLFFYLPFGTDYRPGFSVFTAGTGVPAERLLGPLQAAIRGVDPELAVSNVQPAAEAGIGPWRALVQIAALVLGSLGLLGLAISTIGVFGITSYTVSQRLREFGIRKALGATDADLYRAILGATLRVLLLGVVPGVVVAYIVAGSVRLLVYGIGQQDPLTFLAVPVLLVAVGLVAAACAARRAARVDPTVALRAE